MSASGPSGPLVYRFKVALTTHYDKLKGKNPAGMVGCQLQSYSELTG